MATEKEPLVYTVQETMRLLRIDDRRTIYEMLDRGELQASGGRRGKGRLLRISRASVHAWAEGRTLDAAPLHMMEWRSGKRRSAS